MLLRHESYSTSKLCEVKMKRLTVLMLLSGGWKKKTSKDGLLNHEKCTNNPNKYRGCLFRIDVVKFKSHCIMKQQAAVWNPGGLSLRLPSNISLWWRISRGTYRMCKQTSPPSTILCCGLASRVRSDTRDPPVGNPFQKVPFQGFIWNAGI